MSDFDGDDDAMIKVLREKPGKPFPFRETANDRQVGGDHYKTGGGTQHWDLFGIEYLMGCATKYVSRWRNKNGVQDLEKAKHYCEKLRERINKGDKLRYTKERGPFDRWAPNSGLDFIELTIIRRIMFWNNSLDITEAISGIDHLLAQPKPINTEAVNDRRSSLDQMNDRVKWLIDQEKHHG